MKGVAAVDGMPCRHILRMASLDGLVGSVAILLAGAPPLKAVTGVTASLLPAGYDAAFQLEETVHASKQEVYAQEIHAQEVRCQEAQQQDRAYR